MGITESLKEKALKAAGSLKSTPTPENIFNNILAQETKALAGAEASDIYAVNKNYELNVGAIKDNYDTEVRNTEQAYNSLYDQNAVSRIINERKIAENMAVLKASKGFLYFYFTMLVVFFGVMIYFVVSIF